jgi:hypothetical protein
MLTDEVIADLQEKISLARLDSQTSVKVDVKILTEILDVLSSRTEATVTLQEALSHMRDHKNYFYLLENNRIEIDDDYVDEDMNFFVNCLISKLARDGIKAEKINDMIKDTLSMDVLDYILYYNY